MIINHNLTQSPDWFHIIDKRNGSLTPLNFSSNINGDWFFNTSSNNLYYLSKSCLYVLISVLRVCFWITTLFLSHALLNKSGWLHVQWYES